MDDDIRSRFRGVNSPPQRPMSRYERPAQRPIPVSPKPVPQTSTPPVPKSVKMPRKNRSKKPLLIMFILLLVLGAGGAGGYIYYKNFRHKKSNVSTVAPASSKAPVLKTTGTVRFIATGDNLAFDSINAAAKQADGSYNYLPMMASLKPLFDVSNIRLCNQTTPSGGDIGGISGYPNFNGATAWTTSFASLGCNVINLASNHINDKGQATIDATLKAWDEHKDVLAVAGANRSATEQSTISYFNGKGLNFAYLAYTTSSNNKQLSDFGVNIYSDERAAQDIAEARKQVDFIIVSMNWGTEDKADITPQQDTISQYLASQNVDIVIGGGTHVVQPVKLLDGTDGHQTLVWYSLGNFLNSQLPIDNLIGGLAVMDIDAATKKITNLRFMPTYMHYEWTAAQKSAGDLNSRHNFMLSPLDLSAEALARSLNNTTVDAQTTRVKTILNKFIPISIITSDQFPKQKTP